MDPTPLFLAGMTSAGVGMYAYSRGVRSGIRYRGHPPAPSPAPEPAHDPTKPDDEPAFDLAQFRADNPTYTPDGRPRVPGSWRFGHRVNPTMLNQERAKLATKSGGHSAERAARAANDDYYDGLYREWKESGGTTDPRLRVAGKKMLGTSVGMFDQAEEEYQATKAARVAGRQVNHDWSARRKVEDDGTVEF